MHYGLIGQSLQHSFSPAFFAARFTDWGLSKTHTYQAFELPTIEDFPALLQAKKLSGLNVTIPYKESIIPFLDELHPDAAAIGAVNTIALDENGRTHGYNTDVVGLQISLDRLCGHKPPQQALIIGKGGAAKAVQWVLNQWEVPFHIVSRGGPLTFKTLQEDLVEACDLLVQTTPLGTFPDVNTCPPLPYEVLGPQHRLLDLVYNPAETRFLTEGQKRGAKGMNGLLMLEEQALASWNIWQSRF